MVVGTEGPPLRGAATDARHHATGRRKLAERDAESKLITLCWFHHRAVHKWVIGVKGSAPDALEWRRPPLMETASERHERLSPDDADFLAEGEDFGEVVDAAEPGSQRWDRQKGA